MAEEIRRGRGYLQNTYARELGDLFDRMPKAVLGAVVVSFADALTADIELHPRDQVLNEWWALYHNNIVPQRPPGPIPENWR